MADNSNGGQYQVSDPSQTTDGNTSITGSVAPTPDGQMPPQTPAAPAAQPAAAAQPSAPNAPDASSPNPGPQGGQVANPQNPQQPQSPRPQAPPTPPTATQKFLQRAREISSDITGGDPYKTTIDPNTGETTRVRQPLSPRALSLSLIMEALQGGLSGAGAHGPDAVGQAAQAGLKQGQQIAEQRQDAQANQDQQAQTDLRTRQQVITNLLQTRQLAQTLGRQSLDEAQKSVAADSAEWQSHQEDQSSIISQGLSHDDAYATLGKLPPGTAQVLITGARPRVDPKTGKPVYQLPNGQPVDQNTPGAYQAPDFTYAVVKPTSKHALTDNDGNLTPEVKDNIKYGFQQIPAGADGKYPANYQVDGKAYQAGTRGTQIAKAMNVDVNKSRAAMGLEPIDISKDTASDSTVRNAMMVYNGVLSSSNGDHQKAYDAVAANPSTAGAAGTIQNWYGGKEAAAHLDNMAQQQAYDSSVMNGDHPLVTRDDAQRAEASHIPAVQAAGKARVAAINKEDNEELSKRAYATAGAEVWKESKVAELKSKLAQQGGSNNPYFNEAPDPQTGIKENYLNSLGQSGQLVREVIKGIAPINMRTKVGAAYAEEAANATNGKFDASKYDSYQKLRNSLTGKQGDYFASGSTALDHLNAAYQSANRLSAVPLVGALSRKGWFGAGAQDNAKKFDTDKKTASIEVGKAVEGGVLTNEDKKSWDAKVESYGPQEFKSAARAMSDLIYDRMQEKRDQLRQLAPAGIVTGLHGMTQRGVDSYNAMTGKGIKIEDQELNNDGSPSSQLANPIAPQPLPGKIQFSPSTKTYWVGGKQTDAHGIPVQ